MENIKKAMQVHRYNQRTLAEVVGVSRVSVNNWLNKKTKPSIYDIRKLAQVLELEEDFVKKEFNK